MACCTFVTTLSFGMNNTIIKWSTGNGLSKVHIQFFFYLVAFLLTLGYGISTEALQINLPATILGSMIGILNANGNIQMARAFEKGPASLTSPLIGANAIFPILGAALIFHEQISILQWMGIAVILGSAIMIQYTPGTADGIEYRPWLFRVFLAILSFGILGILMNTTSHLQISPLRYPDLYVRRRKHLSRSHKLTGKRKLAAIRSKYRLTCRIGKHNRLQLLFLYLANRYG